jgi:hypothetical protein
MSLQLFSFSINRMMSIHIYFPIAFHVMFNIEPHVQHFPEIVVPELRIPEILKKVLRTATELQTIFQHIAP